MPLRVVPEEGQNVLPEDSTPWAKELPSSTSHSNRSLRTEVFVAGKRNFQRGAKEAETTLEIQRRRCRDKITLGNSANSGLIARFRESRLERECVVGPGGPTQANTFSDLLSTTLADFSGTGFPNQFFNDSWGVGFWRADHGRHDVELGRRASRMAQAVLGSPGP